MNERGIMEEREKGKGLLSHAIFFCAECPWAPTLFLFPKQTENTSEECSVTLRFDGCKPWNVFLRLRDWCKTLEFVAVASWLCTFYGALVWAFCHQDWRFKTKAPPPLPSPIAALLSPTPTPHAPGLMTDDCALGEGSAVGGFRAGWI